MDNHYNIQPDFNQKMTQPAKLMAANASILAQAAAIDRTMLTMLDRDLRVEHFVKGSLHDITLTVKRSDGPLTGEDQTGIAQYLCACKRSIFNKLPSLKNHNDFAALCSDLNKISNRAAKEILNALIPSIAIDKLRIAKIIVKISEIAALRSDHVQFLYADSEIKLPIYCGAPLKILDLLQNKPQNSEPRTMLLIIGYAPIAGTGDFTLKLDNNVIKHVILDKLFLEQWSTSQIAILCHDKIWAKVEIFDHPDPKQNVYKILEVLHIEHDNEPLQSSIDFKPSD